MAEEYGTSSPPQGTSIEGGSSGGGNPLGNIFGTFFTTIWSVISQMWNNQEAATRESQARAENFQYNERAAENADMRTRSLYNDLYSPGAQLQQIKEAGLSPSLFYGDGGGISGQTGAQGGGAGGISPNVFGMPALDFTQLGRTMAETRLLDAQARKTDAEAKQVEPTSKATIANLLADAGYKTAAEAVQRATEAGQLLENYVKEHTKDAQITTLCAHAEQAEHEAVKAYHEMRNAKCTADFNEETYDTHVQMAKEQLNQVIQAIVESKSNVRVNNQRIHLIRESMLRDIEETMIKWKQVDINERQFDKYEDWIDAQIPYIKDQINLKLKELDIENRRLITETIVGTLKALAIGASAASYAKGAQGSLTQPNPKDVLGGPKGKAVQHRSFEYKDIWSE